MSAFQSSSRRQLGAWQCGVITSGVARVHPAGASSMPMSATVRFAVSCPTLRSPHGARAPAASSHASS